MRVAVLMGGRSAEREVSIMSGSHVAAALRSRGHDVTTLDVDAWDRLVGDAFDCVFVALHGRGGEDGTVQGLFEVLGLPYTGSGVLASALCMDKARANGLLASVGIHIPEYEELGSWDASSAARLAARFGLPVVVKPVREGSTIGLTIASTEEEIASGLVLAGAYDRRILVQRFVRGTEITLGILATPEIRVLPTLEITHASCVYDYAAKYTAGGSRHIIPARISDAAEAAATRDAGIAFRTLGCDGMARVDMVVDDNDVPWVLDVNTIPGLTELSLLPDAAAAAGIPFDEMCDRLIRHAVASRGAGSPSGAR